MQETNYMERVVDLVYAASGKGPHAMNELVNALVEGVALCAVAPGSAEKQAVFLDQVGTHIRERSDELLANFQSFIQDGSVEVQSDEPACPTPETKH